MQCSSLLTWHIQRLLQGNPIFFGQCVYAFLIGPLENIWRGHSAFKPALALLWVRLRVCSGVTSGQLCPGHPALYAQTCQKESFERAESKEQQEYCSWQDFTGFVVNYLNNVLKKKRNPTQIWLLVPMWDAFIARHLQTNACKRKKNVPDVGLNLFWGLDLAWETELAWEFQSVHNISILADPAGNQGASSIEQPWRTLS